ncbi:MAG: L-threonylcarbamoyladenylate synthase [Candidatus Omnitrophica bacterium]|nr:L-threonylcarbamoyladenylate synthase [Candidatus Omnitrophota bacterium]MCM8777600.1 L-threonylcarbamoyladenylate synthase [Candidatus Omnitrophota bacterium]
MKTIVISLHKEIVPEIENILKSGGVAIIPTDTVYGLICDGLNNKAKERIYEIKGRNKDKPLIGFVDTIEKVKKFAEIPLEKEKILKENWPGAKTYILKAKKDIYLITARTGKIAFRITAHNFVINLCKNFDIIASTSANFSKDKSPASIEEIPETLKEKVDIVIDGGRLKGVPSEIWDITGNCPVQLR